MKAIILAAGYATRLYPLTINRPKALLDIGGQPIIDYICDGLDSLGEADAVYVVSNDRFYARFSEWAAERAGRWRAFAPVALNDGTRSEETRLGAIRDIWFAINEAAIDEDVLVIAGDNFFTYELSDLWAYYRSVDADCVVVRRESDLSLLRRVGVAELGPDGRVLSLEEKPGEPRSDYAVYATYIYKRDTLPLIGQYLDEGNNADAPGNLPAWLCTRRRIMAYCFSGECYDIGTKESYENVRKTFG